MIRPALLVLCCVALTLGAEPDRDRVRLLSLGNSFSGCALQYLPQIAKAAGCRLEVTHLMIGGSSLEVHWKLAARAVADPADVKGGYLRGSLPESLAKPWDAVTIQQYSKIANDPATYRPFADQLVALIRARAPQATIYLHETWAYRSDDPLYRESPAMPDADAMHRQVAAAYAGVAKDLDLRIIPVGDAFHLVAGDPRWAFTSDPAWDRKAAQYPALPAQTHSLHVGWTWTAEKKILQFDGHHANATGCYLAGCVWFEVLFHRAVAGNSFRPTGMSDADATYLQGMAHRAVAEHDKALAVPTAR